MLLNHATQTLEDTDVVTSALEQFRNRPALGFSDCLVPETARKAGHLPLGTFDQGLASWMARDFEPAQYAVNRCLGNITSGRHVAADPRIRA